MRLDEVLRRVRFVVDPESGEKSAVLIDYALWEELLELLRDSEDSREVGRLHGSEGETTTSEQVEAESEDCGSEDDAWITEAINKVCAEVDTSLDPAIAAMQWATLRKVEW